MNSDSGGSTKEYDYICTPEGLSVIAVKTGGARSFFYVQTDHLGSIRVVTTASKEIQARYYYDAWGKQTLMSGTGITNRGYLAQEHLTDFALINLNARLYDPVLARFMGMDPYVQAPGFTQSFNRYAYGLNNPLIYADPDGEFWWIIAGAIIGAYLGGVASNNGELNPGEWNWKEPATYLGMFLGGVVGGVGAYGILNPGTVSFSFGVFGEYGGYAAGLGLVTYTGFKSDWNFRWTTPAEGGGEVPLGKDRNPLSPEQVAAKAYEETRASGWDWTFYTGTGMTAMSETFFSQDLGTWMGKNGKIYDQKWGGNQYTGGKYKFANNFAKPFKWGSNALGIYSIGNSIYQSIEGEISPAEATGDVIFGSAAIYSGFYGGWANLWYNLGKEYGPMTTYLRKQEERRRYKSILFNY
jgi:RHS repeat-associated protein